MPDTDTPIPSSTELEYLCAQACLARRDYECERALFIQYASLYSKILIEKRKSTLFAVVNRLTLYRERITEAFN